MLTKSLGMIANAFPMLAPLGTVLTSAAPIIGPDSYNKKLLKILGELELIDIKLDEMQGATK